MMVITSVEAVVAGRHHDAVAGHVHHARGLITAPSITPTEAMMRMVLKLTPRWAPTADCKEVDRIVAHADKQVEDGQA